MRPKLCLLLFLSVLFLQRCTVKRQSLPEEYNVVWYSPSGNASESMPCGGGDIGLNIWAEDGDILFYMARSGTFDENNTLVKLGRIRLCFDPNPFIGGEFRQELILEDGLVRIRGKNNDLEGDLEIWVDVHRPVIHAGLNCNREVRAEVAYESWRYEDRLLYRGESRENSYKWAPPDSLIKRSDRIDFEGDGILFYHRNLSPTVFDVTVHQQALDSVKSLMYDPLKNLTYGGMLRGNKLQPAGTTEGIYRDTEFRGWRLSSSEPAKSHEVEIFLYTDNVDDPGQWKAGLKETIREAEESSMQAADNTRQWWHRFWERSFIYTGGGNQSDTVPLSQLGRNYQLFRYMLGCNAYGEWPTKFNGGLFTFDPSYIREDWPFTPDFRNWAGGTFTAQNQRLVYFPMLKSGDFDMMRPQFDFYLRSLRNAELRSQVYWNHDGACFTEQLENFGLPDCTEYGWSRPPGMDPGMQHNAWLEYQWDTALEFCLMILKLREYSGEDISRYIPLIESCLTFFDEHYRYLARQRGDSALDSLGHLVLYPGSACETYKDACNATSTIAALQKILEALLATPEEIPDQAKRERWEDMQRTIPPITFREIEGHPVIAPAKSWGRVQNTEIPQLYPVFPWRIYGVGRPGLDTAMNTWKYDPDVQAFRNYVSWKQYNIMAACLGLREEAARESVRKLRDSGRRFPVFWGPGFDWAPDHNWGGAGMIGLQEMLLQTRGDRIFLFPAWPPEWDVHFLLHAPGNTVVEARLHNGKPELLSINPAGREKDVSILLEGYRQMQEE